MRLLQVCNVGQIVGGTAACAWTVVQSLPGWEHTVAFLSRPTAETRRAFAGCRVLDWGAGVGRPLTPALSPEGRGSCQYDVVLLHNTGRGRLAGRFPVATVQYLHSTIRPAPADVTVYCSRWLARRYGGDEADVCYQGVPRPPGIGARFPAGESARGGVRALRDDLVIGRLCTPQRKKWPGEVVGLYERLAGWFPQVRWEFVGCPEALQPPLREACRGRCAFHRAGWAARSRLWEWDALLYHNPRVTESFGRTVAEALRAGGIPIVDDRGGFREQVVPECGFLCRDEIDFAGAVAEILEPGRRWAMSRCCMAYGDERFSVEGFGVRLLGVFRAAEQRKGAETQRGRGGGPRGAARGL